MSLIGSKCKRGDTFSLRVLIGRGLFLFDSCEFDTSKALSFIQYEKFSKKIEKSLDK